MRWYKDPWVWTILIFGSPFLFMAALMMYEAMYLMLTGNYPDPILGGNK